MAGFLGNARMEHDLEQQIAQFILERRNVGAGNGVRNLIGFLDRVRSDRLKGLRGIPVAAALRIAQPRHDREETFKRGHDWSPIQG